MLAQNPSFMGKACQFSLGKSSWTVFGVVFDVGHGLQIADTVAFSVLFYSQKEHFIKK